MSAEIWCGNHSFVQRSFFTVAILAVLLSAPLIQAQDGAPGGAPAGGPPSGMPPGGPGGPGGGPQSSKYTLSGVLSAGKAETKSENGKNYTSDKKDVSAIYAYDGGSITLEKPAIVTSGGTSSNDNSSFYGLNAAALASSGGKLVIHGGTITTSGDGANGAFAAGKGSYAELSDVFIKATGGGGHGVMASNAGTMKITNVNMDTTGRSGAAIATDRGGGTITSFGGTLKTAGQGSPSIYSTGNITVTKATMISTGAEGAVIEGSNSITVIDSAMTSDKLCGAMLYQSFSGDAQGVDSHFNMTGGSFTVNAGPIFCVNNTNGTIKLSGVKLSSVSGVVLKAAPERWGKSGSNGGKAVLIAEKQELPGDLIVGDAGSSINAMLKDGSTLNGAIQGASLTLDASSKWIVKADSKLAGLTDTTGLSGDIFTNIVSNGHTVTYKAQDGKNSWLAGKSYSLSGGGKLIPE
jgi:hypothetical protein